MSFWIQTNHPNPNDFYYVPLMFPVYEVYDHKLGFNGIVSIRYVDISNSTYPPVAAYPELAEFRFYLYQLDPAVPDVFGIYSQLNGRTFWIFLYPQDPDYPLRYLVSATPPTQSHAKFQITSVNGSVTDKRIYSPVYQKYIRASSTVLGYNVVNTPDSMCTFKFMYKTGLGPVIPKPSYALTVSQKATYLIISTKYGKALKASLTAPHLSLQNIDFESVPQQFYFKSQGTPVIAQPFLPFLYNCFLGEHQDQMLCFEENGTIGLRTVAGPWEELMIDSTEDNGSNVRFGSFQIQSRRFGNKLRAHSNDTVSLDPYGASAADEIMWTFVPVLAGVPYLSNGALEGANSANLAVTSKNAEPSTPSATAEGRTTIHKLMLCVMCLSLVAILTFVYTTLSARPTHSHPLSG